MNEGQAKQVRPEIELGDILAALWRGLRSPRTTFYLLVIIAIGSVIGILIPQGQPPEYYSHKYGQLGASVIHHFGVNNLYSATWYVLLLALLTLSLAACARRIWRLAQARFAGPELTILQRRLEADGSPTIESAVDNNLQSTQAALAIGLRKRWYTVETAEGGDKSHWLVGRKWRHAAFGVLLSHLAVFAIAAGAVLGVWPGLAVDKTIKLIEGETYEDPEGHFDFALQLNDFSLEYYPGGGTVKAYKSDLSILDGGQEVKRKTVLVNQPLSYHHFGFFQSTWGLAGFTLKVTPANGEVETVEFPLAPAAAHEHDDTQVYQIPANESVKFIEDEKTAIVASAFVPDAWEQDGDIVGWQSEFPRNPAVKITVVSGFATGEHDFAELGWVKEGQTVAYNGGAIQLAGVQYYSGIGVRRDYGVPLVWLGFITLFGGLVLTFYFKPHTVVAKITEAGGRVSVALSAFHPTGSGGERWALQQAPALQQIINSLGGE